MDVQISDFYLLIGILGGLVVGYIGNEIVFMSSRVLSRGDSTEQRARAASGSAIEKERYESTLLWSLRRKYLAVSLSAVPLIFAWAAFGLFYAINIIFSQTGVQVRSVSSRFCWCL
jgi:hypothetical protein